MMTYFGLWSATQIQQALELLRSLRVKYELREEEVDRSRLEEWCAWDAEADHPNMAFHLFVSNVDLPKLGTKLVERFPERKFSAS